ncbi:unnamed protein product [Withania somnifera]
MSDAKPAPYPKRSTQFVDFLVQFRWIVVVYFVLPFSCLYYFSIYLGDVRFIRASRVVIGMRNCDYKCARHFKVDLSKFRNILEINKARMVAEATIPMHLSLAVIGELDDPTVGGPINGFGIKGSSHIYGLFSRHSSSLLEVVLVDGRVVRATKDNEYSDLFYAIPWSQRTLGLLVSAEIKLIPVKEYMILTYKPITSSLKELAQAYANSFELRDGDQENPTKVPDSMVLPTCSNCSEKREFVEYIPTRDYCHRHTRSIYWEGKLILPFGDQFWFRYLFGWLMPPNYIRNYYHDHHVIQDLLVPLHKVADTLEWVHREMEVYHIWLCPHRIYKLPVKPMIYPEPEFEAHKRQGDTKYAQTYTDVGVYYAPGAVLRGEPYDGAKKFREVEVFLIENHGFQPQYSVTELSEKNFWRMFDGTLYKQCRRKYKAIGTFMNVYYKCKKGKKTEKDVQEAEQEKAELDTREGDEAAD